MISAVYRLTERQFAALCELLSLRTSRSNDALRLHLVEGLSVPDAARRAGCTYTAAWKAVKRAARGIELARQVALTKKIMTSPAPEATHTPPWLPSRSSRS